MKNSFLVCWAYYPDGSSPFLSRMYAFLMPALMFSPIWGVFLLSFVFMLSNFSLSFLSYREFLPLPPVPAPQANRIAGIVFLDEYLETTDF